MELQLTGRIDTVFQPETKGTFTFRMLWLTLDHTGSYPQKVEVQWSGKNLDAAKGFKEGDVVKIDFNIRGNEYNGRRYTTLTGWRIAHAAGQPATPSTFNNSDGTKTETAFGEPDPNESSLPF